MSQFYIGDDDRIGVQRCKDSQIDGLPITITGLTEEDQVKGYTGVVQSLVHDAKRDPGKRWRVTILD